MPTLLDEDTKQALLDHAERGDELFERMADHMNTAYLLHERFKQLIKDGDAEKAYAGLVAIGAALRPLAVMLQGMEKYNVE